MTHRLPNGVRIPTIAALNDSLADGNTGYAIMLAGGAAFSRKTIEKTARGYRITNHIDDSQMTLTETQLLDEGRTNIGVAMKRGALVTLDN